MHCQGGVVKKRQKKSFLLIEAVTASILALIAMLACISIFFFLWKASSHQQSALEKESLHWRRVSTLRWTLSRIKRSAKDDPFTLQENDGIRSRLIFVFDHGAHVNPKLSNDDLAQLYVDPEKGLILVTRSHPKRFCIGQEEEVASLIWPGVKNIEWRFAIRPKDKTNLVGVDQYLKDNWVTTWRAEWPGLPAVIQAIITEEDNRQTIVTAIALKDLGAILLK